MDGMFWYSIRQPEARRKAFTNRFGWRRVGVIPQYALMPDGSYCGSTFFYKSLAAD